MQRKHLSSLNQELNQNIICKEYLPIIYEEQSKCDVS